MPGGCILQRPCFCPHNTDGARALCPIHWFWPWVRGASRSGALLFRTINARNVNRFTRRAFAILGVPAAGRYSSHGFRRGAAKELEESGSQWPIVASVGQWGGLSFRNYIELLEDLSKDMAQLFTQPYDFMSDEEGKASPEVHRRVYLPLPRPSMSPIYQAV